MLKPENNKIKVKLEQHIQSFMFVDGGNTESNKHKRCLQHIRIRERTAAYGCIHHVITDTRSLHMTNE